MQGPFIFSKFNFSVSTRAAGYTAQVVLRWHVQMGFSVIPGSRNVDHIRDNLAVLDFALTDADMAAIATLDKGIRYNNRTDEQLVQFAAWQPTYEKA